jgi:hypothetical protein
MPLCEHESAVAPSQQEFKHQGYLVLRNLIDVRMADGLYRYVQTRAEFQRIAPDKQVPGSPAAYGDPNMEMLLVKLRPSLEKVTGTRLLPTYSYYRFYRQGATLESHRDRPACEISLSLNVGQQPRDPWPLWIRAFTGPFAAELFPGDALLYRGAECEHWREAFPGENMVQIFLHYVDADGKHAEWKFDKRHSLNLGQVAT